MGNVIEKYEVRGLFGKYNIDIPFEENSLIIVGENGTGKSTVANSIYYTISCQWGRLAQIEFDSITITLSGDKISFKHEEVEELHDTDIDLRARHLPRSLLKRAKEIARRIRPNNIAEFSSILEEELGLPRIHARKIAKNTGIDKLSNATNEKESKIKEKFNSRVLFLPTYRRIERDLAAIFSTGQDPRERIDEFRDRLRSKSRGGSYLELVEFGMDDVQKMIEKTMTRLKDALRNDLDELTGEYLREVLREEYKSANLEELRSIKKETIESMLDRTDEAVLPSADKENLRQTISDIRKNVDLKSDEKVVAHFLTKLLELHEKQGERERSVREFIHLCNQYIKDKNIKFDNTEFTLSVYDGDEKSDTHKIRLPQLSSGEKQIISLFAHLYMSSKDPFYVIIDEPELSLSMPWQKRFLPDILDTSQCAGLLAVTHSPFIFDNRLEKNTHSIEEYKTHQS